jgi:hypothetical protein
MIDLDGLFGSLEDRIRGLDYLWAQSFMPQSWKVRVRFSYCIEAGGVFPLFLVFR